MASSEATSRNVQRARDSLLSRKFDAAILELCRTRLAYLDAEEKRLEYERQSITDEWLHDVGMNFIVDENHSVPVTHRRLFRNASIGIVFYNGEWQVVVDEEDGEDSITIAVVENRGDVLRIMEALKIK